MGFADTARAGQLLAELGFGDDAATGADRPVLTALAAAADPGLALAGLARMAPDAGLRRALHGDPVLRDRLVSVLGASAALGDHLARHPGDYRLLTAASPFPAPDASPDGTAGLPAAAAASRGERPDRRALARRHHGRPR